MLMVNILPFTQVNYLQKMYWDLDTGFTKPAEGVEI